MRNLQKNNLVAQANKIIEARYSITKNEQLLLFAMISLINPDDNKFLVFSVTYENLVNILNIDKKSGNREIKNIIKRLMSRLITINTPKGWKIFQWVSSATLENNLITLKFHEDLKPYLLELKKEGNFTQTKLGIVIHFKSIYSIRIYQILKEYNCKNMNYIEFSLKEFRNMMLGDKINKYSSYKEFRKYILDVARKELTSKDPETGYYKSDLSFDLKTRRTGRKISHLKFFIKKQSISKIIEKKIITPKVQPEQAISHLISPKETKGLSILTQHGLNPKIAIKYMEEQGEDNIIDTVTIYEERIKNKEVKTLNGGYLIKLLDERVGQKTPYEKEQEEVQKQIALTAEKIAKSKQIFEKKQEEKQAQKNRLLDDYFNNLSKEEQDLINKTLIDNLNLGERTFYNSSGLEHPAILAKRHLFLQDKLNPEEKYKYGEDIDLDSLSSNEKYHLKNRQEAFYFFIKLPKLEQDAIVKKLPGKGFIEYQVGGAKSKYFLDVLSQFLIDYDIIKKW